MALPQRSGPTIGGALKPEYIVLHDTASGLNDSGSISRADRKSQQGSAQVVIGRDATSRR
jgi:N-acetylmuramoyl-L-alanine amidase